MSKGNCIAFYPNNIQKAHIKAWLISEKGFRFHDIINRNTLNIDIDFAIHNIIPRNSLYSQNNFLSEELHRLWCLIDALQTGKAGSTVTNIKNPGTYNDFSRNGYLTVEGVFFYYYPYKRHLTFSTLPYPDQVAKYQALVAQYCQKQFKCEVTDITSFLPSSTSAEPTTTKRKDNKDPSSQQYLLYVALQGLCFDYAKTARSPSGIKAIANTIKCYEASWNNDTALIIMLETIKTHCIHRCSKSTLGYCYNRYLRGRDERVENLYKVLAEIDIHNVSSLKKAAAEISNHSFHLIKDYNEEGYDTFKPKYTKSF